MSKPKENRAVLHQGGGDATLKDADIAVVAGGEDSGEGANNVAIGFDGSGKEKGKSGNINITGGNIEILAGAGRKQDDANTREWKAELQKIFGPDEDVIKKVLRELKKELGVITVKDLKLLEDDEINNMKSITGVAKRKFLAHVKKMREE